MLAVIEPNVIYSIQALIICSLLVALNVRASKLIGERASTRTLSILALIAASIITFADLVQIAQLGSWMIIGLVGGGLILSASIYERYGLNLNKS